MRHPVLIVLVLVSAGCRGASNPTQANADDAPASPEWFRDVTDELGIQHRLAVGPTDRYFMPQVMGSGVAIFDADNDGRPDILVLANAGPKSDSTHRLLLQNPDGKFRDATAGSGLGVPGHGMGVAIGDFDNDGFLDAYISEFGGGRLFRNKGNATFEDVTVTAGVIVPKWGTSCSFLDYDRDGWLDLVVVTYIDYDSSRDCTGGGGRPDYCHPNRFNGTAARLFHNRGRGTDGKWLGFEDVTARSGLAAKPSSGLGVVCADFTGDGWIDIFVANDARANHLWVNKHDGTFEERALTMNIAYNAVGNPQANMGVALTDLHGHGRGDLFVTHLSEELHTLWKQEAPGRFRDVTGAAGLASTRYRGTGFGTIAIDFDHDGFADIAVANGRVMRSRDGSIPTSIRADLPSFWQDYAERNQLFAGDAGGKFRDIGKGNEAFCGPAAVFRGLAWADLDGDGAIDLVTTEIEGPVRAFKNIAPKKGHWLIVRAFDPNLKRDALGAVVHVKTGDRSRIGFACPGQSYCSSGDARAHFGLGPASTIDEIRVNWPDGTSEVFPGGAVDRAITLNRGAGRKVDR
jgi:hypothetical protein